MFDDLDICQRNLDSLIYQGIKDYWDFDDEDDLDDQR